MVFTFLKGFEKNMTFHVTHKACSIYHLALYRKSWLTLGTNRRFHSTGWKSESTGGTSKNTGVQEPTPGWLSQPLPGVLWWG